TTNTTKARLSQRFHTLRVVNAHHSAAPPSSRHTTPVSTRPINEPPLSPTTNHEADDPDKRHPRPYAPTVTDRATGCCSVGAHQLPHRYRAPDGTLQCDQIGFESHALRAWSRAPMAVHQNAFLYFLRPSKTRRKARSTQG